MYLPFQVNLPLSEEPSSEKSKLLHNTFFQRDGNLLIPIFKIHILDLKIINIFNTLSILTMCINLHRRNLYSLQFISKHESSKYFYICTSKIIQIDFEIKIYQFTFNKVFKNSEYKMFKKNIPVAIKTNLHLFKKAAYQ